MASKNRMPDFKKLYPEASEKVIAVMRTTERKMQYLEYDLKVERTVVDALGQTVKVIPSREDLYERLLEQNAQFQGNDEIVEKQIFRNIQVKQLPEALSLLSDDELDLIQQLFFLERTERDVAELHGIYRNAVHKRKLRILDKLKKFSKIFDMEGVQKTLQDAVKKDIIARNPAGRIDKPKKNSYRSSHYTEEEMLTLFDVIDGDPLKLAIKIAACYGLRRSEALGLKWDAINFKEKVIAINHKAIEVEVDGKFIPVGEDVLKTKSSIRTLPLLPAVEELLLAEQEKQETFRRLLKSLLPRVSQLYLCRSNGQTAPAQFCDRTFFLEAVTA